MANNILTAVGLAFFLFGLFVFFTAVLGLYRFDHALNRMHAAAVGDALGIFCMMAGVVCLQAHAALPALKAVLALLFLWITSPVATHLIAQAEVATNPNLKAECKEERR